MKRRILAIFMAITLGAILSNGAWAEPVTVQGANGAVSGAAGQVQSGGGMNAAQGNAATSAASDPGPNGGDASISVDTCSAGKEILGLVPWYNGLLNGSCEVDIEGKGGLDEVLGIIIGNVSYDLFRVVAYLAVGYIMYSGYMYLTAFGEPAKAARAQKNLTGAIIGMMIALLASAIVRFVVEKVFVFNVNGGVYKGDTTLLVNNILSGVYEVAGIVAVCMLIYGGVTFATSMGDAAKIKKGKNVMIYSLVGLVVVIMAWAITNFILKQIGL